MPLGILNSMPLGILIGLLDSDLLKAKGNTSSCDDTSYPEPSQGKGSMLYPGCPSCGKHQYQDALVAALQSLKDRPWINKDR